jgi:glycosyltransferase involved in cell wall biosynthesis
MISFIIPAHNEEQHLGTTLHAVAAAGQGSGHEYEVIVVDDASTDRTAEIAQDFGARVLSVQNRQIAATRNAGARVANGDIFFFVDADTRPNAQAVRACIREISRGAVGGGCVFRFDGVLPLWAVFLYPVAVMLARTIKLVGGCFLFCRRDVFEKTGGFNERFYAAEEIAFIGELKRHGRFAIPRPTVITSGRKLRAHSAWTILDLVRKWGVSGPQAFQKREGLEIWYGERQIDPVAGPDRKAGSEGNGKAGKLSKG